MNEKSPCDIVLSYKRLSAMSDYEVLRLLVTLFPEHELYSISVHWRKDKNYILKARGIKGDVIVGWVENQYDSNQSTNQVNIRHCPTL